MNYYFTDHRAPWYIPRGDDPEIWATLLSLIPVAMVATFTPIAIVTGSPLLYGFMALSLAVAWRWFINVYRYIVKIPSGTLYTAMHCWDALKGIAEDYRKNPGLREAIEPVLIASYDLARQSRAEALDDRLAAVHELVSDDSRRGGADNADLDELRSILKIRREMRRDGLL